MRFLPLLLLAVGCGSPPVATSLANDPATHEPASAATSRGSFPSIRAGERFEIQMWVPSQENFVPHSPLVLEWLSCSARIGIDESVGSRSCKAIAPTFAKLEQRADLERCYLVTNRPATSATVATVQGDFAPGARSSPSSKAIVVVAQILDRTSEVPIYANGEGARPPQCPDDHPGCDYGMDPHRPRAAQIGKKLSTQHTEQPPTLWASAPLPSKYASIPIAIAIPMIPTPTGTQPDPRFEAMGVNVPAREQNPLAIAADIASRLDAIDLTREPKIVVEAAWANRVLVAMLQKDKSAVVRAGAELAKVSMVSGNTLANVHEIEARKLVFADPCQ